MSTIGNVTVGRMSAEALRAALEAGGYEALVGREADIKRAAKSGCLLWSSTRLTTTDSSRIDERPAREGGRR